MKTQHSQKKQQTKETLLLPWSLSYPYPDWLYNLSLFMGYGWLGGEVDSSYGASLLCFPLSAAAKSLQSCLTLCDAQPTRLPVPGILQTRTLEWVAISFSNAWKWKVKVQSLSCVRLFAISWTAAYQAPLSVRFAWQTNKATLSFSVGWKNIFSKESCHSFWCLVRSFCI